LLAFVVAWSRAKGIATASLTTLLAFGYIAVMVWVVRPLLVRLAAKVTGSSLSHDLIAVVMLLLLASSSATELIGIHALFGAFLLGAILPRDGGLAHALAEKLEVVVVVVLVPLFFAYSGLRTQIGLLDSSAAWVTCGLIILVACIGKWGAGTLAARLTGMTWRESGALGVLMNTRGLMVLIVLNIGLDLGVISPTLFTMMVLMALFTTVVATPVLDRVYPSTQHVRDLLARSASGTKTDHEPQAEPFRMLVCIADETSGRGLLDMAAALAGTRSESSVQALHLLRPGDSAAPIDPRSDELGAMLKHVSFVSADPAQEICRVAKVKGADLVLMGRRGARDDRLLGRTVHRVLEESSDMVAVFLDGGPSRIRNVAVHVFGTVHDEATLQLARRLEDGGAHITVVRGFQEQRGESFGPFAGRANVRHDLVVTSLIDEGASAPRFARACLEQCARGVSVLLVRSPLGRPDQRGDS
jgi:nucleotide-binding universal stress UspA family protein